MSNKMINLCPNDNGESVIYLKSNSKAGVNKIDFSSTETYQADSNKIYNKPTLFRCIKCGLIFSEFYKTKFEENYRDVIDHAYVDQINYKKLYFENFTKKILEFCSKDKSLLEIGAYYGAFGSIIKDHVKSYVGLELSEHAVKYAKEKYNLNILTYNANEYLKTSNNFDIIVMYDVIEHLDNPFQMLNDISKKLNPNGILIFTTMNMDAFVPKLMGRRYPWIIFMHKFYFTNKSIKKILEQKSLELIKIKRDTRIISMGYFMDKLAINFPIFKKLFFMIKKIKILNKLKVKVNFFDLNIYIAKKSS